MNVVLIIVVVLDFGTLIVLYSLNAGLLLKMCSKISGACKEISKKSTFGICSSIENADK